MWLETIVNNLHLQNTSERNQKDTKGQDGDDMDIEGVPVTDREEVMYVEKETAITFFVFKVSDYNREDLFVRVEQFEDLDILLGDVIHSHVILSRASFRMYTLV